MSNVKGKGQRLIPEELLKYLQELKNTYPEALEIVSANPTLEGGEDSLSSVLIKGTKYAVGGGGSTLEDIVDSAGNKRFIEGNGTPETITGMTISYNKWSLSGTHLMCVLAGTFEGNVSSNTDIVNFALPVWIKNKIYPVYDDNITRSSFTFYYSTGTPYNRIVKFNKTNEGVSFKLESNIDVTSGSVVFRVQFDLLIDSE